MQKEFRYPAAKLYIGNSGRKLIFQLTKIIQNYEKKSEWYVENPTSY